MKGAELHVFDKSRFVVDVERLIDDDLERIGQGIVYTRFGDELNREVSNHEHQTLMDDYHHYIGQLRDDIIFTDNQGVRPIVIDCHSFPSDLLYGKAPDVCIGVNDDFASPSHKQLAAIVRHFEKNGYRVAVNEPYSNAIQPVENEHEISTPYFSFMIEMNKRCYMDEARLTLDNNFVHMRTTLLGLYEKLLVLE